MIKWLYEHSDQARKEGKRSDEEKHLELSRIVLNSSKRANEIKEDVAKTADDTMMLFVATARWHDKYTFELKKYRK